LKAAKSVGVRFYEDAATGDLVMNTPPDLAADLALPRQKCSRMLSGCLI
jgi:hypothetical protein